MYSNFHESQVYCLNPVSEINVCFTVSFLSTGQIEEILQRLDATLLSPHKVQVYLDITKCSLASNQKYKKGVKCRLYSCLRIYTY